MEREQRVDRRGEVQDPLQAVDDVAHLAHVLRRRRPAEAGGHALGEEAAQRRAGAQPVGVAEVAGVDEAVERGDDRRLAWGSPCRPPRRRGGRARGAATSRPAWPAARRGPARRSRRRRRRPRSRPAAAWDLLPCAGRLQALDRQAVRAATPGAAPAAARARRPAARSGPWAGGRPRPSPGGRALGARSRRTSRRSRTTAGRGRRGAPRPPASGRRGARRRAPDGRARCRPAPTPRPAPRARPPPAARSCAGRPRPAPPPGRPAPASMSPVRCCATAGVALGGLAPDGRLQHVALAVGVAGEVGEHVADGPAGEERRSTDLGVLQGVEVGEEPLVGRRAALDGVVELPPGPVRPGRSCVPVVHAGDRTVGSGSWLDPPRSSSSTPATGRASRSAAFGVMGRGWARGWRVGVVQFVKSGQWKTGEQKLADHLGVEWHALGDGFTWESTDLDETEADGPPRLEGGRRHAGLGRLRPADPRRDHLHHDVRLGAGGRGRRRHRRAVARTPTWCAPGGTRPPS